MLLMQQRKFVPLTIKKNFLTNIIGVIIALCVKKPKEWDLVLIVERVSLVI
jgi:hypothetical protein